MEFVYSIVYSFGYALFLYTTSRKYPYKVK
jgi:hypothetical protein